MKTRKIALLTAIIMVFVMILSACGGNAGAGNTLPVNVGSDPDTIDPALNSAVDGATMIIHAFEGLYTLDKDGVPIPGQALDCTNIR